jgi:hypothetical protein
MIKTTQLFSSTVLVTGLVLTACSGGSNQYASSSTPAAVAPVAPSSGTATSVSSDFSLSGVVTGDAGATIATSGSAATSVGTDSAGNFSFTSISPGSYTVTPSHSGKIFTPVSRAETVTSASITDVTFAASTSTAATYTLSGTVSGSVMAGVTITLNGVNIGAAVTDLAGNYSFAGLTSGTYTVSAALDGYTFTTPLIVAIAAADSTGSNFTSSTLAGDSLAFTAVATLPKATVGSAYSNTVVNAIAGGMAPYRYQSGLLDDGTPPLGMIVNPNGKLTGTPTEPGLYDFTVCAVDATGALSSCQPTSLTVVAADTGTAPPSPAATVSLSASPATTTAGSSTTLKWSSTDATSCTASGGWAGTRAVSGSLAVTPVATTTYALSCAGPGGAGKASVVVTVKTPGSTVPTVSLTSSAATLNAGSAATLKWSSTNATTCAASGGWSGSKGASGSASVTPQTTTTYTLACTNSAGSAQASTKVTVNATSTPAPTVKLSASAATITAGGTSTLTWSSSNADSCTASGGWSGAKEDSGTANATPASTTTYTLSCSGAGGTTAASTTVAVASATSASGTSWVYYNGTFDWPGDFNFAAVGDYSDTSGAPLSGAHDIKMTSSAYGGWLPYAQNWNFNSAPYTKLTFALKPTRSGQVWQVYFVKVGDIPVGIALNVAQYGPTPVAGQWATYTVPLKDLGVLGTSIYKFAIQDQSGANGNVWYIDNVGFAP